MLFISNYIIGTNLPTLIVLKHVNLHLNLKLHYTIIYSRGTNHTGTAILRCNYSNYQFDKHIIRNGQELFVDADHSCVVSNHQSISCILFNVLIVIVNCKSGKKRYIATHSTDSEIFAFYIETKKEE